jgi:hypothetical protein
MLGRIKQFLHCLFCAHRSVDWTENFAYTTGWKSRKVYACECGRVFGKTRLKNHRQTHV